MATLEKFGTLVVTSFIIHRIMKTRHGFYMSTRESFLTGNATLFCTQFPTGFLAVVSTFEGFFAFECTGELFWVNTARNGLFMAALRDCL